MTQPEREGLPFFELMFDVLPVEASFSVCYYIHAELYFDMSL